MTRLRESPHYILGCSDRYRGEAEYLERAAGRAEAYSPVLADKMRLRAKQFRRAADRCKLIAKKGGAE